MKEKVVFILGAGFSAPLGLPVMSNFLSKSKDMYFADPEKYSYFQDVFDTINRLSVIKNYFYQTFSTLRKYYQYWKWKLSLTATR